MEGLVISQGLLFTYAEGFLSLGAPSGIPKTEGYTGIVYRIPSQSSRERQIGEARQTPNPKACRGSYKVILTKSVRGHSDFI